MLLEEGCPATQTTRQGRLQDGTSMLLVAAHKAMSMQMRRTRTIKRGAAASHVTHVLAAAVHLVICSGDLGERGYDRASGGTAGTGEGAYDHATGGTGGRGQGAYDPCEGRDEPLYSAASATRTACAPASH